MASSFEVASISTTRAVLLGMEKFTVMLGKERDGDSFIGNSGTRAIPIKAAAINRTMTANDDMFLLFGKAKEFIYK